MSWLVRFGTTSSTIPRIFLGEEERGLEGEDGEGVGRDDRDG